MEGDGLGTWQSIGVSTALHLLFSQQNHRIKIECFMDMIQPKTFSKTKWEISGGWEFIKCFSIRKDPTMIFKDYFLLGYFPHPTENHL